MKLRAPRPGIPSVFLISSLLAAVPAMTDAADREPDAKARPPAGAPAKGKIPVHPGLLEGGAAELRIREPSGTQGKPARRKAVKPTAEGGTLPRALPRPSRPGARVRSRPMGKEKKGVRGPGPHGVQIMKPARIERSKGTGVTPGRPVTQKGVPSGPVSGRRNRANVKEDPFRRELRPLPLGIPKPSVGGKPQMVPPKRPPVPFRGMPSGPGGFAGGGVVPVARDMRVVVETVQADDGDPVRAGAGECLRVRSNGSRLVLRGRGFGERPGTVMVGLGMASRVLAGAGRRIAVTVTRWTDTAIELAAGIVFPRTGEGERPASQALRFAISRPDGVERTFVQPVCPERRTISVALAGEIYRTVCRTRADGRFDINVVVAKHGLRPSPASIVGRVTTTISRSYSGDPPSYPGDPPAAQAWSGRFRLSLPAWDGDQPIRAYAVHFSCKDGARGSRGSISVPAAPWRVRFEENEWFKRSFVRLLDESPLNHSIDLPGIAEGAEPLHIRSIWVWSEPGDHPKGSTPGIRVVVSKLASGPVADASVVTAHVVEVQPTAARPGLPSPRHVRLRLRPDGSGAWKAELGPEEVRRLYIRAVPIEWGSQLEVRLVRVRGRGEPPALIERRRVQIPPAQGWDVEVRLKQIRVRESGDDDLFRGDGDWEEVYLSLGRDCLVRVDLGTTSVADGDVLRPVRPAVCTVNRTSLPVEGFVGVYEDDGVSSARYITTAIGRFSILDPSIPTRSPRNNYRVRIRGRGLDADAFLEVVLRRSVPREGAIFRAGWS